MLGDALGVDDVGDWVGETVGVGNCVGLTVKPQHVTGHTKAVSESAHNPWSR